MYFMKEMMYTQNIYSITEDMQWVEFFSTHFTYRLFPLNLNASLGQLEIFHSYQNLNVRYVRITFFDFN